MARRPAGWPAWVRGPDGRPVRGNKNIETSEAPCLNKKHICCKGNSSSQWEAAIKTEEAISATASHFPQITPAVEPSVVKRAGREDGCLLRKEGETECDTTQRSYDLVKLKGCEVSLSSPDKNRYPQEWRLMFYTWVPEAFIYCLTWKPSYLLAMRNHLQHFFLPVHFENVSGLRQ